MAYHFTSLTVNGICCHQTITFTNSLYQNQARLNVQPDLNPNCWHSDGIPESIYEKKLILKKKSKKKSADDNKSCKIFKYAKS